MIFLFNANLSKIFKNQHNCTQNNTQPSKKTTIPSLATNIFAPGNGWFVADDSFPFGIWPIFRGYVCFSEGITPTSRVITPQLSIYFRPFIISIYI